MKFHPMNPASGKSLFGHFEEFRARLLSCVGAVLVTSAASFYYSDALLKALSSPIRRLTSEVYFFSPADAFTVKVKVSLLAGAVLGAPWLCWQGWSYLSPGLLPAEKKWVLPFALVTAVFFLLGVLFAFYAVTPPALGFLLGQATDFFRPMLSMNEYISFLSAMLLAFGAAFDLPVVIVALVWTGLVSARTLNRYHRHAIVLIFVGAAILTPPDAASMLLLALPLCLLFELSLAGAWTVERLRKNAL
jgi:sec-independent protein translocase protein TatC